jgi:hypothetical protein
MNEVGATVATVMELEVDVNVTPEVTRSTILSRPAS